MGISTRAAIPYPDGTVANNFSLHMQQLAQATDDKYAMMRQGLLSARPVTPEQRSMYWATNDRGGKLYYGDGSSHYEIGPSVVAGPVSGYTGLISGAASSLTSDVVLGVRGKAGQTGDLLQLQTSAPLTKIGFTVGGSIYLTDTNQSVVSDQLDDMQGPKHRIDMRGGAGILVTETTAASSWVVASVKTAVTALTVSASAGQTGNLQDWSVNGVAKAYIDPAGTLVTTGSAFVNGGVVRLRATSSSTWRDTLSFDNNVGTPGWQLLSDTTGSGSTDFGLWNDLQSAFAWTTTAAREMSIHNKVTVGGGARVSTAGIIDIAGDMAMREGDGIRVAGGSAPSRLVVQDSSLIYLGGVDGGSRDVALRSGGTNRMLISASAIRAYPQHLYAGVGAAGSGANLHIDSNPFGTGTDVFVSAEATSGNSNLYIASQGAGFFELLAGSFPIIQGSPGSSTFGKIGFFGATPLVKQTVTGSLSGGSALSSLLNVLHTYGIITDVTSP